MSQAQRGLVIPKHGEVGLIGHGAILSNAKGNTCLKRHQKEQNDLHVWAQNNTEQDR